MRAAFKNHKLLLAAGLVVLATGCANTTQIEEANATAQRALQTAEQALRAAQEASSKADAAMAEAEASQQCCRDAHDKIDKAFERSQYK